MKSSLVSLVAFTLGCAAASPPPPAPPGPPPVHPPAAQVSPPVFGPALPDEKHFTDLRQLTFEGENAEAYWSFDGQSLTMQSQLPGQGCDRIYRMSVLDGSNTRVPVSSGQGATTCSYFLPGDSQEIYASTHLGGAACPPKPDHGKGYVWPLYEDYDIFKTNPGGALTRLTDTKGYDAEGTVCAKDGSILFTSVRDGDLELYRMDADGKNVRRLTHTLGYDGGGFFNSDCTRIVWRAARPKPGPELEDYQALLAQHLVRPTKLEIYVANADGSDATQLTYLDAASFAPFFHPSGKRVLFASNYGDPKGREFDIWAVDDTGTRLERITRAPGFDGFPMFSPDGSQLAFSSNRNTPPGSHDTHVFLAHWAEGQVETTLETAADRVLADIRYLAAPEREGRGLGLPGLVASGAYIEQRFKDLGLEPAGDRGSFRQSFVVPTALQKGEGTGFAVDGKPLDAKDFAPLGFSPQKAGAQGDLVLAGYGIVDKEKQRDDYAGLAVRGKIALVRRFVPEGPSFDKTEDKRRFGDLHYKAWLAKERGAKALVVVDDPEAPAGAANDWKAPEEASLPLLTPEGYGDAGIPVVMLRRAVGHALIERLVKKERVTAKVTLELAPVTTDAFNVVARIPAGVPAKQRLKGTLVIGAHYDHLGHGGRYSLAPGNTEPHVGADDNASGVAGVLEIAKLLAAERGQLRRDVVVVAFSGEESGLLGSSHFVRTSDAGKNPALPNKGGFAMLNLDMVGRLHENKVTVLGGETAAEWGELVPPACATARIDCALAPDGGYGPSDQMSFFIGGMPVLHFFTGAHSDYHKPSDTPDKINAAGAGRIALAVAEVAKSLAAREKPLKFDAKAKSEPARGDLRSFNASLGTIPDYAGPGPGKSGVLLGGVRPGGAAEKGGMRRGDLMIRLGTHDINSIEDFMYVLNASKPGETAKVVVIRDGKRVELDV
ncbi:MAG TPA: M20/M25/M40 family metallo-hydrolase, partial [Polyangiaceae bacterium]|nr:M20/M25/M40 family metallo-hydrolase [Polyangiaceae bacterium]